MWTERNDHVILRNEELANFEDACWSPDGRRLAVVWYTELLGPRREGPSDGRGVEAPHRNHGCRRHEPSRSQDCQRNTPLHLRLGLAMTPSASVSTLLMTEGIRELEL